MIFRRGRRPSYYFTGKNRGGWLQLCTHTPDKRLAQKVEAMWVELAEEQRAWDVLDRVIAKTLSLADLYDVWRESGRDVHELRRRLNDTDVEPVVGEFLESYAHRVRPDSLAHVTHHLRHLFPKGTPRQVSQVTADWLTQQLAAYPGKRNTLRKVHASWSVFFAHCTRVKKLFRANPMEEVERPPIERSLIRFYELDVIEKIIENQPTAERKALFALLYGGAAESTTALAVTRADVNASTREVRAPGTKVHTRDRVLRVDDWAWPFVWEHARKVLGAARLFPLAWTRHQVHDWHSAALDVIPELPKHFPPYNARHAWAARHLRAGTPVKVVQQQLGHASPNLTLSLYGQFLPSGADRDHWQQQTTEYEQKRREAK
jgi:integrase